MDKARKWLAFGLFVYGIDVFASFIFSIVQLCNGQITFVNFIIPMVKDIVIVVVLSVLLNLLNEPSFVIKSQKESSTPYIPPTATRCEHCGATIKKTDLVCSACGAKNTAAKLSCDSCGAAIENGQTVCHNCGNEIKPL